MPASNALAVVREQPRAVAAPSAPFDFDGMLRMAAKLVASRFLPEHIKTAEQAVAIILTGQELGMPPMRALRSLQMVKGKVSESADSQLARFKTDGGRATFKELSETRAELHLQHPNGDTHIETFTIADAQKAGLAGPGSMYQKYPKAMLRSRAITGGLKSIGWEGGSGVYDPSEAREFAPSGVTVQDSDARDELDPERSEVLEVLLAIEPDASVREKIQRRQARGMTPQELEAAIDYLAERAEARSADVATAEVAAPRAIDVSDLYEVDAHAAADADYAAARPISDEERAAFRAAKQGDLLPPGAAAERRNAVAAGH